MDLFENYTEDDINWEAEDEESLTWPALPKKVQDFFVAKFDKQIQQTPLTANKVIEKLVELGFNKDHVEIFINVFEQERILNQEKSLMFDWIKFKDLVGNIGVDILQKKKGKHVEDEIIEFEQMEEEMKQMQSNISKFFE